MTDQWTPPSKRNPLTVDLAGLDIPRGRYALPAPDEFLYGATGTPEGAARIQQHYEGKLPLADLQPDEITFLRNFFTQQITERRERTLAHFANHVPRRYANVAPGDAATAWARAAATNPHTTRSLLVIGPTGTGKTHYAYSVLRALAETGAGNWTATTAADLYAQLRPRTGRDSEAEFERFTKISALFVDDLGAAKLTEWTEEVTYRLINHRYEQCLPGIYTSNVPPAQLRGVLGERIASRLVEMCERVVLKGDDRRKGMAA